ncbi:hypothetical protein D3C86_1729170 [compost metagenome]
MVLTSEAYNSSKVGRVTKLLLTGIFAAINIGSLILWYPLIISAAKPVVAKSNFVNSMLLFIELS